MMPEPKNIQYLKQWVKGHRPDLKDFNCMTDNAALLTLMLMGFEAGRCFQALNPKAELDNPNIYL